MSVGSLGLYSKDGRLKGSYVYMLLCNDRERVHVKVGMSSRPLERMRELVNNCPVPPTRFAFAKAWSRDKALQIEQGLHHDMDRWRGYGEWFTLSKDHKSEFNGIWKRVFATHSKPGWEMRWEQIPVVPFMEQAKQRQQYFRARFARMGRAQKDFLKHLQSDAG